MKFNKSVPDFIPDQALLQEPVIGLEKRGRILINERSVGVCALTEKRKTSLRVEVVMRK